jgi:archaellum component FlaC
MENKIRTQVEEYEKQISDVLASYHRLTGAVIALKELLKDEGGG